MSSLGAPGNNAIDSDKLCSDFISFLLGNPLSTSEIMQSCLQQLRTRLFIATDASREVVLLSLIYAQRYTIATASADDSSAARAQLLTQGLGKYQYLDMTVACRLAFKWHDDRHIQWQAVSALDLDAIDKFEWEFSQTNHFTLFVSKPRPSK
ncbi:hypothetical protein K492DRAFT_187845 [Lichtheimia hyalospora FSU 10163]|nr:hypothetical protein K492DRAFT_187845 [Lichtheimia hyalospora FSU 10163]